MTTFAGNGHRDEIDGKSLEASFNHPFDLDFDHTGDYLFVVNIFGQNIKQIHNGMFFWFSFVFQLFSLCFGVFYCSV